MAVAVVCAAAAAVACSTSGETGGVWRGIAPIASASNSLIYADDGGPLAVELVLGEYGPDLAGVLRFYRGDSFLQPRTQDAPDMACACALVHSGKVDTATGRAVFTLTGCLPGSSPHAKLRTIANLTLTPTDLLVTLKVDDAVSPLHGSSLDLQLQRFASAGNVSDADLVCPLGGAGGNPASGQ